MNTTFDDFIIAHIFSYLDYLSLFRIRTTCKRYNKIVMDNVENFEVMQLFVSQKIITNLMRSCEMPITILNTHNKTEIPVIALPHNTVGIGGMQTKCEFYYVDEVLIYENPNCAKTILLFDFITQYEKHIQNLYEKCLRDERFEKVRECDFTKYNYVSIKRFGYIELKIPKKHIRLCDIIPNYSDNIGIVFHPTMVILNSCSYTIALELDYMCVNHNSVLSTNML